MLMFLNRHRFFLIILIAAFLLRLPAIYWGISLFNANQKSYHPDEPKTVIAACKFPPVITVCAHPTFYHYLLGVLSIPIKKAVRFDTPKTFMIAYSLIYLFSRIITIFFGLGCLLILYLWGIRKRDKVLGLISAGLLAVVSEHVLASSIAITYVPLSFFLVLGFYKLDTIGKDFAYKDFIQLGIISGLAVSTKFTGFLFFIPMIIYAAYFIFYLTPDRRVYILRGVVLCLILVFLIIAVTTPSIFSKDMWNDIMYESGVVRGSDYPIFDIALWGIAFRNLLITAGLPLGLVLAAGIFYTSGSDISKYAFWCMLMGYFLYFRGGILLRYMVSLLPLFVFFSAVMIMDVYKKILFKKFFLAIMSVIAACSLFYTLSCIYLRINDTRTQAACFVNSNFASGTRIFFSNAAAHPWYYHGWRYPNVDFQKYNYADNPEEADILIFSSYDYAGIKEALDKGLISNDYRDITVPDLSWRLFYLPPPGIVRFYDNVLNNKTKTYYLLNSFKRNKWFRSELDSPDIMIYGKSS